MVNSQRFPPLPTGLNYNSNGAETSSSVPANTKGDREGDPMRTMTERTSSISSCTRTSNGSSPMDGKYFEHMNARPNACLSTISTYIPSTGPTESADRTLSPIQETVCTSLLRACQHGCGSSTTRSGSSKCSDFEDSHGGSSGDLACFQEEPMELNHHHLVRAHRNAVRQKHSKPPMAENRSINTGGTQSSVGSRSKTGEHVPVPVLEGSGNTPNSNPAMIKENKPGIELFKTNGIGATVNGTVREVAHSFFDPTSEEQALFEQRLCDENSGVAVRKINQYGKSNLRYVRCILVDEASAVMRRRSISSHSAGSWGRQLFPQPVKKELEVESSIDRMSKPQDHQQVESNNSRRVMTWGKKKDVQVPLDCFVCVRNGKTTERAKRNSAPSSRILSLITNDPSQLSLDIEAPTKLDRDKFARAFARFLAVPLEGDDSRSVHSAEIGLHQSPLSSTGIVIARGGRPPQPQPIVSYLKSLPSVDANNCPDRSTRERNDDLGGFETRAEALHVAENSDALHHSLPHISAAPLAMDLNTTSNSEPNNISVGEASCSEALQAKAFVTIPINPPGKSAGKKGSEGDDVSHISSLTRNGFDQELVEELHNALTELRAELEESRAEAARAVKVAEQAIQSAERNNSIEWQNTVTHKAAEAAARAQKQSASALAKARLAEERLEGERRAAQFWRKQAELAEEDAGTLQTRAAAAEVQRAAVEQQLKLERRRLQTSMESLRDRTSQTDSNQRIALEGVVAQNRALLVELDAARRDLMLRSNGVVEIANNAVGDESTKQRPSGPKDHEFDPNVFLLRDASSSSSPVDTPEGVTDLSENIASELLQLHVDTQEVRRDFELMRRATVDDFIRLPLEAKVWSNQVSNLINSSQTEVLRLQDQLAMESAARRKLLYEVQDLRGIVRVYCRPRPFDGEHASEQLLSIPSRDTLVVHRERYAASAGCMGPTSCEFDRVFSPTASQDDVYTEIEDVCLSVLDGYNICLLTHGPADCGKTHTILGDVDCKDSETVRIQDYGIQLKLLSQLFKIAEHRSDRYKDTLSLTIVEVYDEKLCDLLAGTELGEMRGEIVSTDSARHRRQKSDEDTYSCKPGKLEIRTDIDGETVIQGVLSVTVTSFDEVLKLWQQCLKSRQQRIVELGVDSKQYYSSSHVLATLRVFSSNITTGTGISGKIQFVDLASADISTRLSQQLSSDLTVTAMSCQRDWRFTNRSLETLNDVLEAKIQFERPVPYRNSTLTHLLQDSLEGDAKVLLIACITDKPSDIEATVATLRFATRMRRLTVGRATRHSFAAS